MKANKLIWIFLLSILSTQSSFGQVLEKNAVTVELYYSIPDWWNLILRQTASSNIYSLNIQSQGPFGGRFEYLFTKRVAFGLDIWYAKTSFTGIYSTTSNPNVYFTGRLTRVNFVPRVTIHLSSHEKLDPYVHFGLGYLYSNLHFQSTNKSVYDESNPLPAVTARFGMGLKYYFTQDFGGFIDVGVGGPLVSFGIFKRWREK